MSCVQLFNLKVSIKAQIQLYVPPTTHPEGQLEGKPGLPAGAVLGRKDVVQVVGEEAVQHDVDGHHDEDAAEGDGPVRLPEVDVPLLDVQQEQLVVGHGEGRRAVVDIQWCCEISRQL